MKYISTFLLVTLFGMIKVYGTSRITEVIVPVIVKVNFKNATHTPIDCKVSVVSKELDRKVERELDPSKKTLFEYAKSQKTPDLLGYTIIYCAASSIQNNDQIDDELREIKDKIIITATGYKNQEIDLYKKITINDDGSVKDTLFVIVELIPE